MDFRYLILGDREINTSVYFRWLDHLNFLSTITDDSKIDWDYYLFFYDNPWIL